MRRLGFDYASIEPEVKAETDELIVVPAVIAREIVQPYGDRKAYKPADELEKAAWTAEGRWVTNRPVAQHLAFDGRCAGGKLRTGPHLPVARFANNFTIEAAWSTDITGSRPPAH